MATQTDVQDNNDGTTTYTYSDGSSQTVDSYTSELISSTGPTSDNSGTSSGTTATQNSYDVNGITYTKNSDGSYSKTTETGTVPSNATEFNTAANGGDPAATATLNPADVSKTPTT